MRSSCNDGSTDASAAKVSEYIKGDERFRLIEHQENSSVLCARISGLRAARGKYISFIDIDDYVEPDYFLKISDSLKASPVDILSIGFIKEPSGEAVMPSVSQDPLRDLLDCKFISALFINIFSREVMDKTLSFLREGYCNMAEDYYIKTIAFNIAESFGCLTEYLYHYIADGGMSSGTKGLSREKLKKQIGYIELAARGMKDYLLKERPELVDMADSTRFTIITSTMYQYGGRCSWRELYEYMGIFCCDEYEPVLKWIFEEFVPLRNSYIKMAAGRK